MGISVPTTNLKDYKYIAVYPGRDEVFAAPWVHYLFLQDVILADIDELWVFLRHTAVANITSYMALTIDQLTVVGSDTVTGGAQTWWENIDVSGYNGIHELGLLWDVTDGGGMPGAASFEWAYVWGKKLLI